MINIFDKWGNPRDQARQATLRDEATHFSSREQRAHGLLPEQVHVMRDRFEKYLPASQWGHKSKADRFFDQMLPQGASLDPGAGRGLDGALRKHAVMRKGASNLPFGGSLSNQTAGGTMTSAQRPYQPEFDRPDRQSYPVHRCLLRGTLVQYASGHVGLIEDVEIGDRLLGPDGRERRVLSKWSSGTPKSLVKVYWSNGRVVCCTPEHVWPTTRGDVLASDLHHDDVCLLARRSTISVTDTDTNELARLTGYYAAEGNILRNTSNDGAVGVRFALHLDEEDLDYDIRRCAAVTFDPIRSVDTRHEGVIARNEIVQGRKIGRLIVTSKRYLIGTNAYVDCRCECGAEPTYLVSTLAVGNTDSCGCRLGFVTDLDPEHSSRYLRITSLRNHNENAAAKQAARWCVKHVGEGSDTKTLSSHIMHWPLALKREFLIGYLRGDGSKRLKPHQTHPTSLGREVSFNTVSMQLGWQISLLLTQCGFAGRTHEQPGYHDKDGGWHEATIEWAIGGERAGELAQLVWPESDVSTHIPANRRTGEALDDNFAYVRVREVETYDNETGDEVFDLTVSDDHCYCLAGGLVTHNSLANIYWRIFYKMDPLVGTGVDMISEMLWSKFKLTGEGVDGEIRDALEEMVEETQLLAVLPHMVREFLVIGEAAPHLFFDDSRGIWTYIALHNPDQLEVIYSPFLKMDPIVEFRPDDRLRQIVMSNNPLLRPMRESMPEGVLSALVSGQNIPLSPVNCTFIPRKLHPYDVRGTSLLSRMWGDFMYEDSIYSASVAIARRSAAPLKVARLGDQNTGWIPDPSQEQRLLELLVAAELDPAAWLIWNYGINFELVGTQERAWKIEQSSEYIERRKLIAMGISKAFVYGEVTYASAASGLTVFLQRLRALRDFFEAKWLYPKFFRPISVMNGWVKPTQAEVSGPGPWVRTKRSARELWEGKRYIVPTIEWQRPLDPSIDSAMIAAMRDLEGLGVKFSKSTKMALVHRDFETELEQQIREAKIEQDAMAKHPELRMQMGAGEPGGGGGVGGGGIMPGLPPESLGLEAPPGGEGAPPPEEGAPPEGGPPPEAAVNPDAEGHGGTAFDADGRAGAWAKSDVTDLANVLGGDEPESEPWTRMIDVWREAAKNHDHYAMAGLRALRAGDIAEGWEMTSDWMLAEGYPPKDVRHLESILKQIGTLGSEQATMVAEIGTQSRDTVDNSGDASLLTGLK